MGGAPREWEVLKHWTLRFMLRLALYGGGLYGLLRLTATRFDATEWNAIILFVAVLVFVEGTMAVLAGNWPHRRRGRAQIATAPAILAFCIALSLAPRPRSTYLDRKPGEPDSSFIPRAIREIARSNA